MNCPRTSMRNGAGHSGFTLVELLVVVAIIATLISILLPSLSRAREMSRMVKCQATLRQFGTAQAMYENEFTSYAIPYDISNDETEYTNSIYWDQNPHFRDVLGLAKEEWSGVYCSPEGLICPNASAVLANSHPDRSEMCRIRDSYGMAYSWDGMSIYNWSKLRGWWTPDIERPASTMFFADGIARYLTYEWRHRYASEGENLNYNPAAAWRHNFSRETKEGTANVLHFDGHVDALSGGTEDGEYELNDIALWPGEYDDG